MIAVAGDMFQIAKAMTAGERGVAIGHGVNRHGLMGAGVAKSVRALFPDAHEAYRQACSEDRYAVGQNQYWSTGTGTWLVNMFTQDRPGPDARLTAIQLCLEAYFGQFHYTPLVIPEIGCGIGGLDRHEVFQIFKQFDDGLVVVSYA